MAVVEQIGVDALGVPEIDIASLEMAFDRKTGSDTLRDIGPVVLINGWYHLTRREDVLHALRTPEVYSSKKAFDMLGSPLPLVPIAIDPPDHTRFRKILQPFFSPNALSGMLGSLQRQAIEIIDDVAVKGECEAVADVAVPYPSQVFLTLYGPAPGRPGPVDRLEGRGDRAERPAHHRRCRPDPRHSSCSVTSPRPSSIVVRIRGPTSSRSC